MKIINFVFVFVFVFNLLIPSARADYLGTLFKKVQLQCGNEGVVEIGQPANFEPVFKGNLTSGEVSFLRNNFTYRWSGACSGSKISCEKTFSQKGIYKTTLEAVSIKGWKSLTATADCYTGVYDKNYYGKKRNLYDDYDIDFRTEEGNTIPINSKTGQGKSDFDYEWSCDKGTLSSNNVEKPSYTAPIVDFDQIATCSVKITNKEEKATYRDIAILIKQAKKCIDSDGGLNRYSMGTVETKSANGNKQTYFDVCLRYGMLREYVCQDDGTAENINYSCSSGCSEGACILPKTAVKYKPRIVLGKDITVKEGDTVRIMAKFSAPYAYSVRPAWYCSRGAFDVNKMESDKNTDSIDYTAPLVDKEKTYFCQVKISDVYDQSDFDNIAIHILEKTKEEKERLRGCTDTDGGDNIYEKGIIAKNNSKKAEDSCIDKNNIKEYYCGEDNKYYYYFDYCENGCKGSACNPLQSQESFCSDSDGGKDYFKKGTVVLPGSGGRYSDSCVNVKKLQEYSCSEEGDDFLEEQINCPKYYFCQKGACQKSEGLGARINRLAASLLQGISNLFIKK